MAEKTEILGEIPKQVLHKTNCVTLSDSSDSERDDRRPVQGKTRTRKAATNKITENACEMSIKNVQSILNVKYLQRKASPTFREIRDIASPDLLQHLLDFAYEGSQTSADIVTEMLHNNVEMSKMGLKFMFENPLYLLNLKECSEEDIKKIKSLSVESNGKVQVLTESLIEYNKFKTGTSTFRDMAVYSSREVLKQCLMNVALVTGFWETFKFRVSGESHLNFERLPFSGETTATGMHPVVRVLPDFIFGDRCGSLQCIPVQVYSPSLSTRMSSTSPKDSGVATESPESTLYKLPLSYPDDEVDLLDVVPELPCMLEDGSYRDFKRALAAEHVSQLYGVAEEVSRRDGVSGAQDITIVGMVMMDEYVFFSKMKLKSYHLRSRLMNTRIQELHETSSPRVEYFPTALDMTRGNHRLSVCSFLANHKIRFFPEKGCN